MEDEHSANLAQYECSRATTVPEDEVPVLTDTSEEKQPNIAIPLPVENAIGDIHVNLGHPEKAVLKRALIQFGCDACKETSPPRSKLLAKMVEKHNTEFNSCIGFDLFVIRNIVRITCKRLNPRQYERGVTLSL